MQNPVLTSRSSCYRRSAKHLHTLLLLAAPLAYPSLFLSSALAADYPALRPVHPLQARPIGPWKSPLGRSRSFQRNAPTPHHPFQATLTFCAVWTQS
eukprot:3350663-Rhodomonas_salina.4